MRCSQAAIWLQLYLDGRLEGQRVPVLRNHIQHCSACQYDLAQWTQLNKMLRASALPFEQPMDLEGLIRARIAVYEARRVAAREVRHAANPLWRERRWQFATLGALIALCYFLLPATTETSLSARLSHGFPGLVEALTAPGPDSVAWAAWVLGALAMFSLALYIVRADASAGLRRSIAERLPQHW